MIAPRYESDLVSRSLAALPAALTHPPKEYKLMREVALGAAIADVVVCSRLPNVGARPNRPLTAAEATVLATLRGSRAIRLDRLAEAVGHRSAHLKSEALRQLANDGLVWECNGGHWYAPNSWRTNPRIHAIEAKLTRWRDAVRQARAYTQFADYSYVLLPMASARLAMANSHTFAEHGVGLLAAANGTVTPLIRATRYDAHNWRREYFISRALSHVPDHSIECRTTTRMER